MEFLFQDVRFAWRSLRKHSGFTAVAVATLALGIGANAAMFAVVNGVILRPLPFPEADRLVRVTADFVATGTDDIGMSPPELYDYRDRSELFDAIAGVYPIDANLTEVDEPERVEILLVSPSYFSLLGVRPQLGRVFNADDNHPGIAEIVVISDALWKRRFGGTPDVIGRKLKIDGDWYELVGVMPPEFHHPGRALRTGTDMWAPTGYQSAAVRASREVQDRLCVGWCNRSAESRPDHIRGQDAPRGLRRTAAGRVPGGVSRPAAGRRGWSSCTTMSWGDRKRRWS